MLWAKVVLLTLLAAIVASLFSGFFFLVKDKSEDRRLLGALKVRVGLSIALVVFLALSFINGWLSPHGVQP